MAGDEATRDEPDAHDEPGVDVRGEHLAGDSDLAGEGPAGEDLAGQHLSDASDPVDSDRAADSGVGPGDQPGLQRDQQPDDAPTTSGGPAGRRGRRRVSKWDRPPEPHDWRWAVGGLGRVLVSVGLLMFGFVAYQLWGTGIQEARAQSRLEDEFNDLLAAATTLPPATTTATTVPVPTTEPAPATSDPGPAPSSTAGTTSTSTTSVPAAVLDRPPVGNPVALLELPSIGVQKTVVEGVTTRALEDGPGHFPETPFPGQLGNAAIAGHRTTYGHPFLELDEVQIGDDVVVTTLAGRYTYVVTETVIVAPDDYAAVIPTTDPGVATLTLLTCHPAYSTDKRLVAIAVLDPARSSVVTLPTPADDIVPAGELPDEEVATTEVVTSTITPDDDTTTGGTASDGAADGAADDGAPTASAAPEETPSTEADAAMPPSPAPTTTVPEDSATAFSAGWFDDTDAWPHVALWGLALTAIALLAYALSRKVRRDWVGAIVGIGPFAVALYFWFENVNRLLPPGL